MVVHYCLVQRNGRSAKTAILIYHYFEMEELQKEYSGILSQQVFDETDLDYTLLERHKSMLTQLAKVSNSGITVFDMHQRKHVFASYNFIDQFGYYVDGIDDRIHPDDMRQIMRNGIEVLKFLYKQKESVGDYKMISEYRMRKTSGEYVRFIEQFSVLETDKSGNVWLSLCVIDLSPDQAPLDSVKCSLLNVKENTFFPVKDLYAKEEGIRLSPREIKILQLVKEGLISKEISEQLFISVHTVNTHRQRILEKLDVDNSMEAVRYASVLGLLG